jgi:RHS repeat-associated protein
MAGPLGGAACSGTYTGLLVKRVDARNVRPCYTYDALSRLTSKTYSDTTPAASFYYDEASFALNGTTYTLTNTKGRLSHTSAAGGTAITIHSYDSMGRTADLWQCTPYNCTSTSIWKTHYNYDLAGDVSNWTQPTGIVFTNSISAAQRNTQITSTYSDSTHPPTLATITYAPHGAVNTLTNGCVGTGCTQRQEKYDYNNRLQPVMIQLGTSATPNANSCIVYNYYSGVANPTSCTTPTQAGTGNNGNAAGYFYQDSSYPTLGHTASFTYDSLDRLATAAATGSSTYNLTYGYDRWGNVTCTGGAGLCTAMTYDPANNNRLSTIGSSPVTYDAAGNLTSDGTGVGTHTYQWDAEGRLASVDSGSTATYTYNALGQRVEKKVGSAYTEIVYDGYGYVTAFHDRTAWSQLFIPSVGGRQIMKYQDTVTYFLHTNLLGSTGMITNHAGTPTQDVLYYPWGQRWAYQGSLRDERFASLGQRDSENSLDPTLFRMYSSGQGRWLSPDPIGGDITNPQSLNRYAYVLNNPTNLIDPLGLGLCDERPITFGCGAGRESIAILGSWLGANGGSLGGTPPSGCTVDFMPWPCDLSRQLVQGGLAANCPNNNCTGVSAKAGPGGTTVITSTVAVQVPGGCVSVNGGPKTCDSPSSVTVMVTVTTNNNDVPLSPQAQAILGRAGRIAAPVADPRGIALWYGASASAAVLVGAAPVAWQAVGGYPGLYVGGAYVSMGASAAINGWGPPAGTGWRGWAGWILAWTFGD